MTTIVMTKEHLLEHLKRQLVIAKAHDKRVAKQHLIDEKAALEAWKNKLREAVRLPLESFKGTDGWRRSELHLSLPGCPMAQAARFERTIAAVKLSDQKRYTMQPSKSSFSLHALVTWDPDANINETVCE